MTKEDVEKEALTYSEEERGIKIHQKAEYYNKNGDYETAILYYEYFLTLKEDNWSLELPALYNKIGTYYKTIAHVNSEWLFKKVNAQLLYIEPRPLYHLGIAYAATGDIESAERNLLLGVNLQKQRNDPYAQTEKGHREMYMYISYFLGGLVEILFNVRDYENAAKYVREAFEYTPFVSTYYYAGHMMFKQLGMAKDIEQAIELLTKVADREVSESDEDLEYVMNSNYDLGMIYATEAGYKDKEKSAFRLNRAKELGYPITDAEISEITENIVEDTKPVTDNGDKSTKKSGGCYVATCVYGSYDCPEVWTLRRFRDNVLSGSVFGRMFIKAYYAISPTIVELFGGYKWFHKMWKAPLDRLVQRLLNEGVENTPYED